jgi:hypothetical protein
MRTIRDHDAGDLPAVLGSGLALAMSLVFAVLALS